MSTQVTNQIITDEGLPTTGDYIATTSDTIIRLSDRNSSGRVIDADDLAQGDGTNLWIECGDYTNFSFSVAGMQGTVNVIPYGAGRLRVLGIQSAGDYDSALAGENNGSADANYVSLDNTLASFSGTPAGQLVLNFITKYDGVIGDADFQGFDGLEATGQLWDKFRILFDARWVSKLSDQGDRNIMLALLYDGNTGITVNWDGVEIRNGGFAGIQDKLDGAGSSATAIRKSNIFKNYFIHDVANEGLYIGSDPDEHSFEDCEFLNGLVVRVGGEGWQGANLTDGCKLQNNVIVMPALEFESPFQGYQAQDKGLQIDWRQGDVEISKNIALGNGSSQVILLPNATAEGYSQDGTLSIKDNFFGEGRHKFMRVNTGDNGTTIDIDNNYIGDYDNSHLDGVLNSEVVDHYIDDANTDLTAYVRNNKLNTASKDILADTRTNIQQVANSNETISNPVFYNSGYPASFDLRDLKEYVVSYIDIGANSGRTGYRNPIQRNVGEVFMYKGLHYECILQHLSHDGTPDTGVLGTPVDDPATDVAGGDGITGTNFKLVTWDSNGLWSVDGGAGTTTHPPDDWRLVANDQYNYLGWGLWHNKPNTNRTYYQWMVADDNQGTNEKTIWRFKTKDPLKADLISEVGSGKFVRCLIAVKNTGGKTSSEYTEYIEL